MRALRLLALLAFGCGPSTPGPSAPTAVSPIDAAPAPAGDAQLDALCRDLDSDDLDTRSAAARELLTHLGPVEGGTEQQMEAAGEFCADRGLSPSWMPAR